MTADSKIVSFVLRFVLDEPAPAPGDFPAGWYGIIRHVQSDAEQHLTSWDEILAFVKKHIEQSIEAKDE